jgi:hypothetical protein
VRGSPWNLRAFLLLFWFHWLGVVLTNPLPRRENVSTPPTPPLLFFCSAFFSSSQTSLQPIHLGSPVLPTVIHQFHSQSVFCHIRQHEQGVSVLIQGRHPQLELYSPPSSFLDVEWEGPVVDIAGNVTGGVQGKH